MATTYKKIEHQKKFFNALGGDYEKGNILNLPTLEKAKKIISKYIYGDVLDIGNGGSICFDIKKAKSVILADLAIELLQSPKMVDHGRFKSVDKKSLRIVQANVMGMPFKDGSFDVVILLYVAHHLSISSVQGSRKNIERSVSEISRVLKKDGVFILGEDYPATFFKLILNWGYPLWYFLCQLIHKPLPYFMSRKEISEIFNKYNMVVINEHHVGFGKRTVYNPIFPFLKPPGWLWDMVLKNKILLIKKGDTKV